MLSDLLEQQAAIEDIIDECFQKAQRELDKIACFRIKLKRNASDVRYGCTDGFFYEEIQDRHEVRRRFFGSDPEALVSHLVDTAIVNYAFRHRKDMQDGEDIISQCYSYLGTDEEA